MQNCFRAPKGVRNKNCRRRPSTGPRATNSPDHVQQTQTTGAHAPATAAPVVHSHLQKGVQSGSVKPNCEKLRKIGGGKTGKWRCRNQPSRSLKEQHFCTGDTQGTNEHARGISQKQLRENCGNCGPRFPLTTNHCDLNGDCCQTRPTAVGDGAGAVTATWFLKPNVGQRDSYALFASGTAPCEETVGRRTWAAWRRATGSVRACVVPRVIYAAL